jgi:hypothetical protein
MAEQVELRPWEWEQIPAGFYAGEPGCAQKLFGYRSRPSS